MKLNERYNKKIENIYYFIPTFSTLLIGLIFFVIINKFYKEDLGNIKEIYKQEKDSVLDEKVKKIEKHFRLIYESIRTISLLPVTKEIILNQGIVSESDKIIIQQIFNNVFFKTNLSEIYISSKEMNPTEINLKTKIMKGPLLKFKKNEVLTLAEIIKKNDDVVKKEEIYEYLEIYKQIKYFEKFHPNNRVFQIANMPIHISKEIVTCDNTNFTKLNYEEENNKGRNGYIISIPVYDKGGLFFGAITAIFRSDILRDMINSPFMGLVNLKHDIAVAKNPGPHWLFNAEAYFKNGLTDSNLNYSKMIEVKIKDTASWSFWVSYPNSDFNNWERLSQLNKAFKTRIYAVSLIFLIVLYFNIKNNRIHDSLNKKVKMRTADLERAKTKAVEDNKAKSNFLVRMNHQIRTPLNGILCGSEILSKKNFSSEKEKEFADIIFFSADRLKNTITNVLDFAKFKETKVSLKESSFNLKEVLKDIHFLFENDSKKERKNKFLLTIEENVPPVIVTDKNVFSRIIINLLSNSHKFTDDGIIETKISLIKKFGDHLILKIIVQDNGKGIGKEYLPHIFSPFTQEDSSLTSVIEGTGLGMPIIKELIVLLDGDIYISSEKGQGTEVIFTIKVNMESSVTKLSHDKVKPNIQMKKMFSDGSEKNILWVDDDLTSKILVQGMLKKEDNEHIDWASSGKEALEMCEKKAYDIIFMDVRMSGMDGIETTVAINQMALERPPVIIAITADATVDNLKKCKKVGMKDFFTKPFDYLKLAEILEKYIDEDS